ncbi:hypothetical protein D5085_18215 [Ectothiorhodospiraceae bacterium BW-2]|nr:hypothetical protein D5085_18215 [Ectothiorhodospiraceae bacterium BW-2]
MAGDGRGGGVGESGVGGGGRVVVGASGTWPLLRVMVEGEEADQVARLAAQLADRVRALVGAA